MRPFTILCALFSGLLSSLAIADTKVQIEFAQEITQYIDGRILTKNQRTRFDCGERIYGVFQLENLENGSHQILTQWKSPGDKIEQVNKRTIAISSARQVVFLSSSIEFAGGDPLSSIIDPAAGFEAYIGKWTVDVVVDDIILGSSSFQVLC